MPQPTWGKKTCAERVIEHRIVQARRAVVSRFSAGRAGRSTGYAAFARFRGDLPKPATRYATAELRRRDAQKASVAKFGSLSIANRQIRTSFFVDLEGHAALWRDQPTVHFCRDICMRRIWAIRVKDPLPLAKTKHSHLSASEQSYCDEAQRG